MAATTLTQARTQVLEHVDDQLGRRFAPTVAGVQDFSRVDRALSAALSDCLIEYARAGGDRFDQEFDFTTSATDGSASLAAQNVLAIRACAVVIAPAIYKIPPKGGMRRGYVDAVARTMRILYVREYALSATPGDPLVGVASVAAPTWPTFDDWVCAVAASRLLVKDAEIRQALELLVAKLQAASISRSNVPASSPWPRPERSMIVADLAWQFVPATQTLYTIRAA